MDVPANLCGAPGSYAVVVMPPSDDVVIPDTWVTSRAAVDAFASWCTRRKWIYQPIDGGNDFGRDGYVDVSRSGSPTGELFSVQVKGGPSWRAAGGYRIPVGKHRRIWKDSSVPVVGIVHDERLRWVNLTNALRDDPECSAVFVADAARLDAPGQSDALLASVRQRAQDCRWGSAASPLTDQESAIWDCFALARRNAAALVALRRSFLAMDDRASRSTAIASSLCTEDVPTVVESVTVPVLLCHLLSLA